MRTDAHGHFRLGGLLEDKTPSSSPIRATIFTASWLDTSAGSQELTLLAHNQTPAALRTLPPRRSARKNSNWPARSSGPCGSGKRRGRRKKSRAGNRTPARAVVATITLPRPFEQGEQESFVSWKMPLLYAADPEEGGPLGIARRSGIHEGLRAVGDRRETPGLSPEQKLELLDRATQHLRATIEPDERVFRLSAVAVRLFKLGKTAEARTLVETVAPAAKQLLPKTNAAACDRLGEALEPLRSAGRVCGSFIPPATQVTSIIGCRSLFHVAYGIARQQPAEAERLAAEAIQFATRSWLKTHQEEHHRDPTDEGRLGTLTWYEIRLVPLCYDWFRSMPLGRSGWRRQSRTLIYGRMPWE